MPLLGWFYEFLISTYWPSSSVCASGRGTNTGSEGEQSISLQHLVVPFITSTFNIFSVNNLKSHEGYSNVRYNHYTTHICRVHRSSHPKTIHKLVFPSIVVLVVHLRKFKCYNFIIVCNTKYDEKPSAAAISFTYEEKRVLDEYKECYHHLAVLQMLWCLLKLPSLNPKQTKFWLSTGY